MYHNLLFATSNSETIYVFDYEFAKLISSINLEHKVTFIISSFRVNMDMNLSFFEGRSAGNAGRQRF